MYNNSRHPFQIVFMGTPQFAAIILQHLVACEKCKIIASYCQADRPSGRGKKIHAPPVKVLSESLGIPVFQPINFKEENARVQLKMLQPDFLIVAAYGLLLPQEVLDIPKVAPLNVHASLLPKYRGAAPIQRAVMNGEVVTGVTIMRMEKTLDTGPMLAQQALAIGLDDTSDMVYNELAVLGGKMLVRIFESMTNGESFSQTHQDDTKATYAEKLSKSDGMVLWDNPVKQVHAHIRGVTMWPGAQTVFVIPGRGDIPVTLQPGSIGPCLQDFGSDTPHAGKVVGLFEGSIAVACSDRVYLIRTLRPAGGTFIEAEAFWNGYIQKNGPLVYCRTENL